MDDLVKRLRALRIIDEVLSTNNLGNEAAVAIKRLSARIAELESGQVSMRLLLQEVEFSGCAIGACHTSDGDLHLRISDALRPKALTASAKEAQEDKT